MTHPNIDFTGKLYGKLRVISFVERINGVNIWLCKCECGNQKNIRSHNLTSGHTLSCGCYQKQMTSKASTKHGHCRSKKLKTPEFASWVDMRTRCLNPNSNRYNTYGARGIKICDRWLESFENFFADMGAKPTPRHSLDRIDNNGSYEKSNCRWSTNKEQARNRTSNVVITYNGEQKILTEWAETLGIKKGTLWARIESGWPIERAFNTKIKRSA
jgi:hypothetical protein